MDATSPFSNSLSYLGLRFHNSLALTVRHMLLIPAFWPSQLLENVYLYIIHIHSYLYYVEKSSGNPAVSPALIPRSEYDRTPLRKSSPQNFISIFVLPTNTSHNYVDLFAIP
jgi:hypothetical protein